MKTLKELKETINNTKQKLLEITEDLKKSNEKQLKILEDCIKITKERSNASIQLKIENGKLVQYKSEISNEIKI